MIRYLFLVIIFLLPFQFALNPGDNIDLGVTRILVPVVFLFWFLEGLAKRNIWIANWVESWLILSFLFLSLFSLWAGLDPEKGVRKVLYLFSIFPIFFVAADLAREVKFRTKIFRAIWISGTLAALVGIVQFLLPFAVGLNSALTIWKKITPLFLGSSFGELVINNPSWLVNVSGKTWMRAFGFFPDPHTFSFFMGLCFFICLGYFAWEKKWKWKVLAGISTVFMFLATVLSFSRGAYLGMLLGSLFFFIILAVKFFGKTGKIAIVGVALAFLLSIFFQETIQNRLTSVFNPKEGSNTERIKNWKQAFEIVRNYPLSGIGLGNYTFYIDPSSKERSSIYAHNTFLDIAAETGILNGLLFIFLILISLSRSAISKNILNLGIASGLTYFLVHSIFDTPIWSPQVMVVLLVILALGVSRPPGSKMAKAGLNQN